MMMMMGMVIVMGKRASDAYSLCLGGADCLYSSTATGMLVLRVWMSERGAQDRNLLGLQECLTSVLE
jgi:hypothetical protein